MRDTSKIAIGLVVFVVLVTFPFWYGAGKRAEPPVPSLDTPVIQGLEEKKCIEDTGFMREYHMQLLGDWRNWVVRDGKTVYVASDGKEYVMSLQNTCLRCHSNKSQFCDSCHHYAGVDPDCWSCHLAPEEPAPEEGAK